VNLPLIIAVAAIADGLDLVAGTVPRIELAICSAFGSLMRLVTAEASFPSPGHHCEQCSVVGFLCLLYSSGSYFVLVQVGLRRSWSSLAVGSN
jgi:hypothetical protein